VHTLAYGLQKRWNWGAPSRSIPAVALDEPMAGMNARRKRTWRYILDINEERAPPCFMIEHDMGVVMDLSHQCGADFGQKIAEGAPRSPAQPPKSRRVLGGHAA